MLYWRCWGGAIACENWSKWSDVKLFVTSVNWDYPLHYSRYVTMKSMYHIVYYPPKINHFIYVLYIYIHDLCACTWNYICLYVCNRVRSLCYILYFMLNLLSGCMWIMCSLHGNPLSDQCLALLEQFKLEHPNITILWCIKLRPHNISYGYEFRCHTF